VLRHRFAASKSPMPVECWKEDGLTYLVFDLRREHPAALLPPVAMFVVDAERQRLVLVRVVTANASNTEAEVHDLYSEGSES